MIPCKVDSVWVLKTGSIAGSINQNTLKWHPYSPKPKYQSNSAPFFDNSSTIGFLWLIVEYLNIEVGNEKQYSWSWRSLCSSSLLWRDLWNVALNGESYGRRASQAVPTRCDGFEFESRTKFAMLMWTSKTFWGGMSRISKEMAGLTEFASQTAGTWFGLSWLSCRACRRAFT